jgi:hypothetical protein
VTDTADTVDDEAPAETEEAPAPTAGRRRRSTGFVVASILAVVFFASTVLLAVVAAGLKSDKDDLIDGRAEVADVAGRFVTALLTYDHNDPEGFRDRVLAFTAPPFNEQFQDAVDELQRLFEGFDAVSVPTIRDVFVTEVADGTATAIVVYDRVLDGVGGRRTESNIYVRLDLVEREDGWRINNVVNLNLAFADAAPTGGDDAGTGGSTTTVPG